MSRFRPLGARGRTRTYTAVGQAILSRPRLPFRHPGSGRWHQSILLPFAGQSEARAATRSALVTDDVGWVTHVGDGVATVRGFTDLRSNELIVFPGGLSAIAASLNEHESGVILLGPADRLLEGAEARRTKRVVDAPVGEALLGRVIDPLGRPLDDRRALPSEERVPVEQLAPPIMHRAPVETPLQTGIKAIDAAIPEGVTPPSSRGSRRPPSRQ